MSVYIEWVKGQNLWNTSKTNKFTTQVLNSWTNQLREMNNVLCLITNEQKKEIYFFVYYIHLLETHNFMLNCVLQYLTIFA